MDALVSILLPSRRLPRWDRRARKGRCQAEKGEYAGDSVDIDTGPVVIDCVERIVVPRYQ